ncbi:hypothetical protein CRYUN_Cryun12cG0055500 [Craigia yunnanensis]
MVLRCCTSHHSHQFSLLTSQGLLITLSQSNGGYKYDYATVSFFAEVFKLLVSSLLLWRECQTSPSPIITTEWKSVRLFPIPSIIYLIHNNIQFATLTYVDTSTYQIMGNLKIVTTAILFRLFLRKKVFYLQWMVIVLLAVGTTTSQVKGCGEASCDSQFTASIQGYILGILSACISALAGVYTEFLMKRNSDSLYWQNLQLHTFTTWLVDLNLGSTGLLVSWLMKYADNIVKFPDHLLSNVLIQCTCCLDLVWENEGMKYGALATKYNVVGVTENRGKDKDKICLKLHLNFKMTSASLVLSKTKFGYYFLSWKDIEIVII